LSKLIADAEASGAFIVTEGNVTCMVTIEPAIYSFDFAKKQQLAAIIYDWAFTTRGKEGCVFFVDRLNGKEVGSYTPAAGLTMN
jgi:hypothetical protein